MPELPEVETVRRGVERRAIGWRVKGVRCARRDMVELAPGQRETSLPHHLLEGDTLARTRRLGKQLAIIGAHGGVVCVHLGMSGSLTVSDEVPSQDTHAHVVWSIVRGRETRFIVFRDPRRFGSLRTFTDIDELERSWSDLGPDALAIRAPTLREGLGESRRAVKAALLDQQVLAGVGNIYADESLFRARIDPRRPCARLRPGEITALAKAIRGVLSEAVTRGGSSIRDYRNSDGEAGSFQESHRVYGRAGLPCVRCGTKLSRIAIAQRTTVFCAHCQV